ncbi:MAG: helix-turn-helix transcriptional regulator [Cyanobacteria bacterium J06634_5]
MTELAYKDVRKILNFLENLHTLTDLPSLGPRVISSLPQVIGSALTSWSPTIFPTHEVSGSVLSKQIGDLPQSAEQIAKQRFLEHPVVEYYLRTGDGSAHTLADFVSERELHRLEGIYQSILRSINIEEQLITVLPIPESEKIDLSSQMAQEIVVALHRPQRNFSECDRLVLNLLRPHLALAYCNAKAVTRIQQNSARLSQTLEEMGVVTLAPSGEVQLLTRRAWELLSHYFSGPYKQAGQLPDNLRRWVRHELKKIDTMESVDNPCLPLRIESEEKQLVIRLVPSRGLHQYSLLLEELPSSRFSPKSLELVGLTPREAQVLFQISQGQKTSEIAVTLKMKEGTVKKHVEHIYEKFDVGTRIAAVLHAFEKLGLMP